MPRGVAVVAALALSFLIFAERASIANEAEAPRRAAVAVYLRHIYWIYFGLRSCREIAASERDASFEPEVTAAGAQESMRAIEAGAREVSVDTKGIWAAAAPRAQVTAEALKEDPGKHLTFCRRMGSLFRDDEANIQAILSALGAQATAIPKDF